MVTSPYFEFALEFTDPGEAEQYLADAYGTVRVTREFQRLRQHLVGDGNIQLHSGEFLGSYSITADIDQFVVASADRTCVWQEGRDGGDMALEPVLLRPHAPYMNFVEDTANRAVLFNRNALEHVARLVYASPDLTLRFDGPHPVRPAGTTWLAASGMAFGQQQAGLLTHDLIRASVFRLLSVAALESFRLIGDRKALHRSARRQQRIHQLAREFIHDHASLPITIDDAAEAAGASIPELDAAFHAADPAPTSPTAYLRSVRLDAAHQDLVSGDPTLGDTVAEISRRWGFSSRSRFAALYRQRYGQTPKWVLDR